MKKTLWISTLNENKIQEFRLLLGDWDLKFLKDLKDNPDIEETADSFEGNALLKAKYLASKTGKPSIGDDSGLEVYGLDGFPGIYSARWAYPELDGDVLSRMLIQKMQDSNLFEDGNTGARFKTVIAFVDPVKNIELFFEGTVEGDILEYKRAGRKFGYDSIFLPKGEVQSFSEMSLDKKNALSHRSKAISKLVYFLEEEYF